MPNAHFQENNIILSDSSNEGSMDLFDSCLLSQYNVGGPIDITSNPGVEVAECTEPDLEDTLSSIPTVKF